MEQRPELTVEPVSPWARAQVMLPVFVPLRADRRAAAVVLAGRQPVRAGRSAAGCCCAGMSSRLPRRAAPRALRPGVAWWLLPIGVFASSRWSPSASAPRTTIRRCPCWLTRCWTATCAQRWRTSAGWPDSGGWCADEPDPSAGHRRVRPGRAGGARRRVGRPPARLAHPDPRRRLPRSSCATRSAASRSAGWPSSASGSGSAGTSSPAERSATSHASCHDRRTCQAVGESALKIRTSARQVGRSWPVRPGCDESAFGHIRLIVR